MILRSVTLGIAVAITTVTLVAQDVRDTPGPMETQARPVTPENPVPRRTASKAVDYPDEMRRSGGRGLVNLQVTLDVEGRIAEIRNTRAQLVQAPGRVDAVADRRTTDALVTSAIAAVRRWTFAAPVEGPLTFPVAFMFFEGVVEEVLAPPQSGRGRGAAPQPSAPPWPAAEGAMRVGGDVPMPRQTKNVKADYPRQALEKRVQGVVIVEILIGTNGKVKDARVIRSVEGLDQAALNAVRKWEYEPPMRNGVAVPVVATATLNFSAR